MFYVGPGASGTHFLTFESRGEGLRQIGDKEGRKHWVCILYSNEQFLDQGRFERFSLKRLPEVVDLICDDDVYADSFEMMRYLCDDIDPIITWIEANINGRWSLDVLGRKHIFSFEETEDAAFFRLTHA